jgi:hypothetical protein
MCFQQLLVDEQFVLIFSVALVNVAGLCTKTDKNVCGIHESV